MTRKVLRIEIKAFDHSFMFAGGEKMTCSLSESIHFSAP